jgi:hypothetical protein
MGYLGFMFELLTEILSNQRVTQDTWLMALRSAEIAQTAQPGQFVMIRVRSEQWLSDRLILLRGVAPQLANWLKDPGAAPEGDRMGL